MNPIAGKDSAKNLAFMVYVLQAISLVVGVTSIVGIIINYVKMNDVKGTWVESHFRWQMRTFWFALLWGVIGFVTIIFIVGYIILAANGIWFIYRIVKGWMRLNEHKPMYTD